MTPARRAALTLLTVVAWLALASEGAEGDDLADRARRAFVHVRVWDITRPAAPTHIAAGSGVLVTREGHILTAWHVVEGAVDKDESLPDDVVPRRDRTVEVRFAPFGTALETKKYGAEVIGYVPTSDLALLRIDLMPGDVVERLRAPVDSAAAQARCRDQCFRVFGVVGVKNDRDEEEWRAQHEEAAPSEDLRDDYRRQLTSNLTFGYSGGPVFFKEKSPWPLVGIALSGEALRQLTTFMISVHAIDPLLNPLRENLDIAERQPFPSPRFLDRAGIRTLKEQELAELVRLMAADPVRFATLLLEEDFERSQRPALEAGKRLLDTTTRALELRLQVTGAFGRFISRILFFTVKPVPPVSDLRLMPILHAALTEKLTIVSRRLEEDSAARARRAVNHASLYRRYCQSLGAIGVNEAALYRCWYRADARFRQIWAWRLRTQRDAFEAEIDAGRTARVVSTAYVIVDHFLTWAEMISEVAEQSTPAALDLMLKRFGPPQPVQTQPRPTPEERSPQFTYRDAALDRFLFAQDMLKFIVHEPSLKSAYQTEAHNSRLRRWCSGMLAEVQTLRGLQRRGAPYELDLERREADIRTQCGP